MYISKIIKVVLTDEEIAALKVLYKGSCEGIRCDECPLAIYDEVSDICHCIKATCGNILAKEGVLDE